MLSRKIRTGAAGLAAMCTLALAAGPIAPGALAETPTKWGHLGIGQAGTITVGNQCGDYQMMFNGDINEMNQAIAAGNYGGSFKAQDSAATVRGQAHDAGCGWAWT